MYYVYKTTNIVNNKIYVGVHKSDNIQSDQYLGSGKILNKSILKYGRDKFKRQTLYQYQNETDAYDMQKLIVDKDFIKRKDTYNIKCGGFGGQKFGFVTVKNKEGKILYVSIDDPRYLSGQLVGLTKGKVVVKDKDGNTFQIDKNDSRYKSGQLVHNTTGMISVKDKEGNTFTVHKTDPRWLSGQLVGVSKGCKRKQGHAVGKNNSQYGTMWITNGKQNKKIKKDNNIPQGWRTGRIIKF